MRGGPDPRVTSVAFHVDQLFFRVPGGIGTYVRELVPALRRADPDLDVTLFHARFDRPLPERWMGSFPVERLPHRIRTLYPGWALAGKPALPPSLPVDIVHAPNPAAVPPPGPGRRLVVTVHDLAFRIYPSMFPPTWRHLFRLGLRRAARTAAALVVPSRHTRADLVRLAPVDPARIHVIPLAASLPASEGDPGPELERMNIPRPYLLYVGTLEARKNLLRLVRAYRRAASASSIPHGLVLAGPSGWGVQGLHRELRLPGPGKVVLTGRATPDGLDALYRGADAFVYPSLYEGFGLPVVEAMARGVPTIVSTAASLPEVAGGAAIAVDPRSVVALAAAIELVLTDRREATRLSRAGRARAESFTWARTARSTLDVYRQVL